MENIYLPGNNYILNENIMMKYGRDFAVLLACLMSADKLFGHNGNGPWFYQTVAEVEKRTGIKTKKQAELLRQMEELGIIERKLMGLPARRYFKINYERAIELSSLNEELENISLVVSKRNNKLCQNESTSYVQKDSTCYVEKTYNNIYNNNINNNIYKEKENIKEKEKTENIRSLTENTPSLLETSKNIETSKEKPTKKKPLKAEKIKNKEIVEEIIAYLNEKANKHFRTTNKEAIKLINGRLSEGYSISDLKAVIDNRVEKWLNDEKMNEYLRPSTLFRPSKFEAYYNDVLSMREKANSEREKEFIKKFSVGLTPPDLPPVKALEKFKEKRKINIMTENDFKILEQWYKEKIVEWNKKFSEKIRNERMVKIGERAKVKTNE